MGLSVAVGTFALPAATNTNYEAVNSLAFEPKLVLFFPTRRTTAGQDTTAAWMHRGAMDASNVCAMGAWCISNDNWVRDTNAACITIDGALGASLAVATAAATRFDSNGFHLNVTKGDTNQYLIGYIAFGGTDLTNTWVGSITTNSSATTGDPKETTGPGFQPNLLNAFTGCEPSSLPTAQNDWWGSYGWATGTTSTGGDYNVAVNYGQIKPAMADTTESQIPGTGSSGATSPSLYRWHNPSTLYDAGHLEAWTTNGFTIDATTASGAYVMEGVALKGLQVKVGTITTPTSTGNQSISDVGFTPSVVLIFGWSRAAGTSTVTRAAQFLGAGTSSSAQFVTNWATTGSDGGTGGAYHARLDTANIVSVEDGAYTTNTTIPQLLTADLVSMTPDSGTGFKLNWTAVAGTARQIMYVAIGAAATSDLTPATQTETVTLDDDSAGTQAQRVDAGQYAYAISDVALGNWTDQASGTSDIYESINEETTPIDTDYIRSGTTPSNDTYVAGLTNTLSTPQAGTVTLRVRARWAS